MFYVYVLESIKNGRRYTGLSSKTPEERLREHNAGSSTWTSKNRPFRIIYSEILENEEVAKKRERYLKSGEGRQFIDKQIPA